MITADVGLPDADKRDTQDTKIARIEPTITRIAKI